MKQSRSGWLAHRLADYQQLRKRGLELLSHHCANSGFVEQALAHLEREHQFCARLQEEKEALTRKVSALKSELAKKDHLINEKEAIICSYMHRQQTSRNYFPDAFKSAGSSPLKTPANVFDIPSISFFSKDKMKSIKKSKPDAASPPEECGREFKMRKTLRLDQSCRKKHLLKAGSGRLSSILQRVAQCEEEREESKRQQHSSEGSLKLCLRVLRSSFSLLGQLPQCGRKQVSLSLGEVSRVLAGLLECAKVEIYFIDSLLRKYRRKDDGEREVLLPFGEGVVGKCHRQNEPIDFHQSNKNYSMPDVPIEVSIVSLRCFTICNDIGMPEFVVLLVNKADGRRFEKEDQLLVELAFCALHRDFSRVFENEEFLDGVLYQTHSFLSRQFLCRTVEELFAVTEKLACQNFVLSKVSFAVFHAGQVVHRSKESGLVEACGVCGLAGEVKKKEEQEPVYYASLNRESEFNALLDIDTGLPAVLLPVLEEGRVCAVFQVVGYKGERGLGPAKERQLHNSLRLVGLCAYSVFVLMQGGRGQ